MFYAGLEIDLDRFKSTKYRSLTFATLRFAFPLLGGAAVALVFGYGWLSAVLIGSLLASHTLLGYPIVSRLGLVHNEAVTVAVGGTIATDTAALVVLALCVSIHTTGFSPASVGLQILQLALYIPGILLGVSWFARRLFHRMGNTDADAMVVLLFIVFIGAATAELINLEGIIGAFLTGLAVNRALSGTPAKEKIEFFGILWEGRYRSRSLRSQRGLQPGRIEAHIPRHPKCQGAQALGCFSTILMWMRLTGNAL